MAEIETRSPSAIQNLVDQLNRLPGIGPKSAQRLAYFLMRCPREHAEELARAIVDVRARVVTCAVCQNVSDRDPCPICASPQRDPSLVCVVEDPLDVAAIERAHVFKGRYHVLHGALSPLDGVGPEQLRIRELLARLRDGEVREVIMATNPTLEGDATAMYLERLLQPLGVTATRLARGLPAGADLEYADEVTLARALEGRRPAS